MPNLNLKTSGLKELKKTPPNQLLPFLKRWQSNNSHKDLGVVRFVFDLYQLSNKYFSNSRPFLKDFIPEYGVAPWAVDSMVMYFTWEPGMTKEDRCMVCATYREGTKTFWHAQCIPLYEGLIGEYGIYNNNHLFPWYDYQLLICKNQTEAGKRLMAISSLLNREIIQHLFGDLKPTFQEVKRKEAKDTDKILILSNQQTYQAVGWNISARGFSMLGGRPDKALLDDPEDKNNTKTPERREDNRRALTEDIFGAITQQGTIMYIGNKINADDTIGHLLNEKNTQWKKQFHTISVLKGNDGKVLPGVGNLDKEVPEWGKRWTIEGIKKRKNWFVQQPAMGGERGWLKEHYNIIKSQADYQIKFHDGKYFRQFGINWLEFSTAQGREIRNIYIVIGNDPAISEKKDTSDAVVNVTAFTSDKRRFILEYSKGKFDIHDRFYDETNRPKLAIKPEELVLLKRKGSAEEIARMFLKYSADAIVIETAGQQMTFFNETKAIINDHLGLYPSILDYTNPMNKVDKLKQNPLAYFEAGLYYIRENMPDLESEVFSFPSTKLDTLDAVHLSEQLAYFPPPIKYDPTGLSYNKIDDVPKSDHKIITAQRDGLVTVELDPMMLL